MSYQQFRQRCTKCNAEWNAAFGIVGTTIIAQAPTECPHCKSPEIEHAGYGWDWTPTESTPNENQNREDDRRS